MPKDRMLTIDEKGVIKVWDLRMSTEIGQMRDLVGGSEIKALVEWRYPDNTADEDVIYEDDEVIFDSDETAGRVFIVSSDGTLRIFNIETLKLERFWKSGLKYNTAMTFLSDKTLLAVGGRQESEF